MGKRACLAFSVACCEADDVTGPSEGDPMPLKAGLEGSDEVDVTVYELLAESIFFEGFLVLPVPRLPAGGGPSTITLVLRHEVSSPRPPVLGRVISSEGLSRTSFLSSRL